MPFCPKCRFEYRDEFTSCPDCDCELTAELPPLPEPKKEEPQKFVFFANVQDGPLGEGVISMLRAYDIPYRRSYSDPGMMTGLYTGKSFFGVDVYVPEERLCEAQELASAQFDMSVAEHSYMIIEDGYESEISYIKRWYREESDIPIDCMEKEGKAYIVYGKDTVLAMIYLCSDGQVGIFPESSHINDDSFYLALNAVIEKAKDMGILEIWADIPIDNQYFSELYRKNGFDYDGVYRMNIGGSI